MGVYIKGMEMPSKTYAHCMLVKDIDGSVRLHVCTRSDVVSSDWDEYPLIPVPDHGRLGDLEALAEDVEIFADENAIGKIEKEELLELVRYAPTIIPSDHKEKEEK